MKRFPFSFDLFGGIFLILLKSSLVSLVLGQECSWSGSDDVSGVRLNKIINLGCREGKIDWTYPYGALWITFRLPFANSSLCLNPSISDVGVSIYQRISSSNLELKLLRTLQPENSDRLIMDNEFCLSDLQQKNVTLFIDSHSWRSSQKKSKFQLVYDITKQLPDGNEVCRPCSDRELQEAFCSSDFVIRSTLDAVHTVDRRSLLVLGPVHVLFQRAPVFSLDGGFLLASSACEIRPSGQQLLITGRISLGKARIGCNAWWSTWQRVKFRAHISGRPLCNLERK